MPPVSYWLPNRHCPGRSCIAMRTVAITIGCLLMLGAHAVPTCAQQPDSTYTVQDGDTLYGIAQQVGASVRSLMKWNDLDTSAVQTGQTLRVRPPSESTRASSADSSSTASASPDSSTVATADTAASDTTGMAAAPDTTAADSPAPDTSTATDTTGSDEGTAPAADSSIEEPDPVAAADTTAPPRPYGRYTVNAGDTFITLALRLGMSADSLLALNDSTTTSLTADSTLRLPRRFSPPRHTVKKGQTLYSIAGEYGVSVRSLTAENDDITPDSLQPGQRLQIPGRRGQDIPPPGTWADPDTTGRVARYPDAFAGRLTASGTTYDPEALVISHPSLPFGSVVLLATPNDDHQTFARVIDRGPIEEGTLLDVSKAIADELELGTDTPSVSLRVVWRNRDATDP